MSLVTKRIRSWHEAPSYFIHVHSLPLSSLLMPFRLSNLQWQKGLGCAKVILHIASKQPIISFTPGTCRTCATKIRLKQKALCSWKIWISSSCCTTTQVVKKCRLHAAFAPNIGQHWSTLVKTLLYQLFEVIVRALSKQACLPLQT